MFVYAVVYYLDGHMRSARKTLYGMYEEESSAQDAQLELCGGTTYKDVNGCVRGVNSVISWICQVELNTPIHWTLAVAGPNH